MRKAVKTLLLNVTNALSLLFFFGLVSTGLIMKYVLPPGSGRLESLSGGGFRGGRPVMTWLDQGRHQWGEWHFILAVAFLVLLMLHMILNWSWIHATAWGTRRLPQSWLRKSITVLMILFILFAVLLPFLIKPEAVTQSA